MSHGNERRDKAQRAGRQLCAQMKELMEQRMYEVVIQAAANGKVVARERLRAFRKNVLAKCYGEVLALWLPMLRLREHACRILVWKVHFTLQAAKQGFLRRKARSDNGLLHLLVQSGASCRLDFLHLECNSKCIRPSDS